jgi:hypothetical protein
VSWPDEERRASDDRDTGQRRRTTDIDGPPTTRELERALARHETEAQVWRARQDQRLRTVENRADLLDGRAGNDGGLIGAIGELRGEIQAFNNRLDTIAADVKDLKNKTGAADGQKPPGRLERILTIVGPILVVFITTIGGIVVAYFAFRGQLAGLQPHTVGKP